jgi:hypothetical protein
MISEETCAPHRYPLVFTESSQYSVPLAVGGTSESNREELSTDAERF